MITNSANTVLQANDKSVGLSLWALVLVKVLVGSKQRLSTTLGRDRRGITLAMLEDVLTALTDSRHVKHIAVVTADVDVARFAAARGALIVQEIESRGMNAAVALGVEQIRRCGGSHAVVLPADIPLATGTELDRLLQRQDEEQQRGGNRVIGLTPSADGRGTNLLCLETDGRFATRYGPNSFLLHQERVLQCCRRPVTLESSDISLDIDGPADLQTFLQTCQDKPGFQATNTWRFLQGLGLPGSFGIAEGG